MKNKDRPTDWREVRRLRAWELHEKGWQQCQIAEALGVTPGAVSQWLKRAEKGVSTRCAHASLLDPPHG